MSHALYEFHHRACSWNILTVQVSKSIYNNNNGWDDDYKEYNGDVDGYYDDYEEYDALKGDGGMTSHHTSRSMPSVAPLPFPDDTRLKKFLRYIRILPPEENEQPAYRKIRIFTWCSLVLDFINAVVALATFGQVTTCCDKPIWGFIPRSVCRNMS